MPKCQFCGKQINWIKTNTGKSTPVELEPINVVENKNGDTVIVTDKGQVIRGNIVGDANEEGYYIGYESHIVKSPYCKKPD
jgi:hypothetical protein